MKNALSLLLALVMCLSLCACGGETQPEAQPTAAPEDAASAAEEITSAEEGIDPAEADSAPAAEATVYQFGDSITSPSGMFVFTPQFHGFAAALANWPDANYLTPDGKGVDESNNPFVADEGHVMMYFSGVVEYIGDSKETETFSFAYQLDYDHGYLFDGPSGVRYSSDEEDWDTNEYASFEPLSSNTVRYVRFCLEVPEALESDVEKETILTIKIEGEPFVFNVDLAAAAQAKADREAAAEAEHAENMTLVDDALASEISSLLQGTWEWDVYGFAGNSMYTTSHALTFDGNAAYIETTNSLLNTYMSNQGTYSITNAYIVSDFEDGSQACMPYTYANGELSISQEFEGEFYTA